VAPVFWTTLYCDLETGVWVHSRSSKVAPFDTAHTCKLTSLYSSSIVTICLHLLPFPTYSSILVENRSCIWRPRCAWVQSRQIYATTVGRKIGLSDRERISMICSAVLNIQITRVTDGQTDGRTKLVWHIGLRAIAYMLSRVKHIVIGVHFGVSVCANTSNLCTSSF